MTICFTIVVAPASMAEPTDVTVRVISKDAKFIGSSMGGVRITLSDTRTGEVLASGLTRGGTGDTSKIMHTDGGRRMRMADDSAASFEARIDVEEPRLIEAEAYGPLDYPDSAHRVTATQWVVPGHDLSVGDGWVLEMPGFVVDVVEPAEYARINADGGRVPVTAKVMMMCGCPIEPDGLWDANRYEITMTVAHDGETSEAIPLDYSGQTSHFSGRVPVSNAGAYQVTVRAYDPQNGNTGIGRTTFVAH
jgi:hypothetical protein